MLMQAAENLGTGAAIGANRRVVPTGAGDEEQTEGARENEHSAPARFYTVMVPEFGSTIQQFVTTLIDYLRKRQTS